ncbi:hypothetical protein ACP275_05G029700 [Erythranthe tilingii]
MASSSCNNNQYLSYKTVIKISSAWRMIVAIVFLGFLVMDSCTAIRPMKKEADDRVSSSSSSMAAFDYFQEKSTEKLLAGDKLYFAKLPKRVPIPPSAPSKRHNSLPGN